MRCATAVNKTLQLGLLGYGPWGRNIHRTLQSFADVSVSVIPRGAGVPADLDGVFIATPSATHVELALPFIERGIATFIEKPMALSIADAECIRDAAIRFSAPIFVGHIHLYNPAFHVTCKLIHALGLLRYVMCEWMNGRPRAGESVLWDWLPHILSMARRMFGKEPESISAWSLAGGMQSQAAVTRFRFGATSLVATTSWLSPYRCRRMVVAGDNATLVFDDAAQRKLTLYAAKGEITYPAYEADLPLTREVAAFLDLVRGGTVDRDHIADAIAITRAILAAETSLRESGAESNTCYRITPRPPSGPSI